MLPVERGVARSHRDIARRRGSVSHERRQIADLGGRVARRRRLQACRGGPLALMSGALANVAAELVGFRVDTGREVAIARCLIAIGGTLVDVRA